MLSFLFVLSPDKYYHIISGMFNKPQKLVVSVRGPNRLGRTCLVHTY